MRASPNAERDPAGEQGPDQEALTGDRTRHHRDRCLTCSGRVAWTEERREAARSYAACHGRQVEEVFC